MSRHTVGRRDQRSAEAAKYRPLYKTARWRARRAEQLGREPFCFMCAEAGKVTAATVANHKIPHRGDEALFFEGELQSVCAPHHDGAIQKAERAGYSGAVDGEGWPTDPKHPANRRR